MPQKIKLFLWCLSLSLLFASQALANKQKYQRYHQKKEAFYQEKNSRYQKKDLPDSGSYFEVSRKTPKVSVEYQPKETVFKINQPNVICHEQNTLSCTGMVVDFTSSTDCEESRIRLNVLETQEITVELSSSYPKESCPFNQILKHELAHVSLYQRTLKDFIKQAELKLAAEYTAGQRLSKGCEYIQKKISDLTNGLKAQYEQTVAEENKKLDLENGSHKYELQVCVQAEK